MYVFSSFCLLVFYSATKCHKFIFRSKGFELSMPAHIKSLNPSKGRFYIPFLIQKPTTSGFVRDTLHASVFIRLVCVTI